MADFATNQMAIAAARAALDRAEVESVRAATRAQQAQSAVDAAIRRRSAHQDGGDDGAIAQLQAAARKAAEERDAARRRLATARGVLTAAGARFADFSDPRQNVGRLSDSTPFLLFPVRIETRFKTIAEVPQRPGIGLPSRHQLRVRIFPDDCSVDTFEPTFSKDELTNVKNYWMNIWRAGGVENDERGAWRNLVAAHGSGRAGWLVDDLQPAPTPPKPTKVSTTDVILIIPTTAAPSAADTAALASYWHAVWLADGDTSTLQAARTALDAAVGAAHAGDLIAAYVPFNLADVPADPLTKADVGVSTAFLVFAPDPEVSLHSWSQAPQVRQFPDRFVVLGFSKNHPTVETLGNPVTLPLYAGPDPSGDPSATIRPDPAPHGPDLFVPDELKWMVDFDRAVAAGMGIAVDLTPEQFAAGFDLLLVVGLQLRTPGDAGPAALQELLSHHQNGRSGFAFLAQGTPAHNSTGAGSGHSRDDDPDESFDDRKNLPLFTPVADAAEKPDGQWFAEFLGLDPMFVATVHGSGGVDQKQARALQTAMWPATLGYWMNTLFTSSDGKTPVFPDEIVDQTRSFVTQFVSGRGPLPAIRIGGQPYGILPATAFSRLRWYDQQNLRALFPSQVFFGNVYRILRQLDAAWTAMSQEAHWVGDGLDPHQTLLNVLAHHPSSVEYFSRTAESLAQLYNTVNFWALGPAWLQVIRALNLQAGAIALLQQLGYTGSALPDLLNHFFLTDNPQITSVVDDRPLSEMEEVRAYTDAGKNYIEWMIENAGSLEIIRAETGFTGNKSPQALLYLYLRHALMLGYYESSYNFHRTTGVLDAPALVAMRTEPTFIHVEATASASESRFAALYKTESRITGSPTMLVSDYIAAHLGLSVETANFAAQVAALKTLATASTAQLERLFAEHMDICAYRYDAWLLGLVSEHIAAQRAVAAGNDQGRAGLYLGAYAWVEDLKPSAQPLTPAPIPPDLAASFPGAEPLATDPAGGGYIHAPSIPHADAAAVLRSGYIASLGQPGDAQGHPDTLAVNLSSDRVRTALSLIEGVRNGQRLGALLGYRFERGLHDDHGLAEVDKFIYPLRKAFPLAADALASTKTDPTVPIEAIEARNVLDGKKLVDRVQSTGNPIYPYGLTGLPAVKNKDEQDALNAETLALLDAYDAVADLALAEGVYQAVQGNYDRVASTLEAYTTGNFPPEPQVVQTPPSGINLTHRFAVQFTPGLAAPAGATPRAQAEPAVDEWLGRMLPPLNTIGCTVEWTDPVTAGPQHVVVTIADLGLRPLDLLYLFKPDNQQAMSELDDRIVQRIVATANPRPDANLKIQYLEAGAGQFSLFEVGPLLRELRNLVTHSRPLRATDVQRPNSASQKDNARVFADATRVSTPLSTLTTIGQDIDTFLAALSPLLADPVANRAALIANVDNYLAQASALLERAARFSMPSSGWGFVYGWLHSAFADLFAQVSALTKRWTQRRDDFDAAMLAYAGLPTGTSDADRFAALQAAELLVGSHLDPLLATPALVEVAVNTKGTAFQTRLTDFQNLLKTPGTAFVPLFTQVASLTTAEFDSQPFDIAPFGDRAVIVTEDVSRLLTGLSSAIATRGKQTQDQLTIAAAATSDADRVQAVQTAAQQMLGEDFRIVPEFTVPTAQGAEWANAVAASTGGELFSHLKDTLHFDFPIDEWLYGAARVRPTMHGWEAALMLGSALGVTPQNLTPIQLPFAANDSWLAMQFPDDYAIDTERLLYTCVYSQAFTPNARQCGLLLDEWTEVIPAQKRDTAIAFNYNRPDNEPPQAMLLVTSASTTGEWAWPDIVDALAETLALAKKRAVEPAFLDPTVYSRFLPATVTASTSYAITIATALTAANGVMNLIEGGGGHA